MPLVLVPALILAGCAGPAYRQDGALPYGAVGASPAWAPTHFYPPPGPPEDPWGPYIREAAGRYGVPEPWVRAVMNQESGGREQAVSPVGAMGLMQVMPATYEMLRVRYGLGEDPYEPRANILAGTAYIREMYDRFGAPGFLAAYNAGPDRVASYLAGTADLPDETVNYVAAITPNLGAGVPLSGPLARYASARHRHGPGTAPSVASLAAGCDLDRAYDPNHPCTTLERAAAAPALAQSAALAPQLGVGGCDLDVAYDPGHPCRPLPAQPAAHTQLAAVGGCDPDLAFDPDRACPAPTAAAATAPTQVAAAPTQVAAAPTLVAAAPIVPRVAPAQPLARARPAPPPDWPVVAAEPAGPAPHQLAIPVREWAIQVGAFANPTLARAVAENARAQAPGELRSAALAVPPTPGGGGVLYRARLVHLSASAASDACWRLNQHQLPCVVVQPNRT